MSFVDPDGEFVVEAILIGAAVGGFFGVARATQNDNISIAGGIWRGALVGAVGGALGGVGVGSSFAANLGMGIGQGALTGTLDAALFGGDIGRSALTGGITGGVFATLTSPQLKNAVKGEGFRSDQKVFADFVEAGDYQGALDYFGFDGTYDPTHPYFQSNPDPAITNTKTGEIFYNKQPFEGNYDKFALIAEHEQFHQQHVFSGKFENVKIDLQIKAQEEWATYLKNYKNQGLYPQHGVNLVERINNYGLQGGIYEFVVTPNGNFSTQFNKKWWHFIYRIPRRY